jgi:hypothetical protein
MYSSLPILDQVYRAGSGRKNNDEENTNVSRPKWICPARTFSHHSWVLHSNNTHIDIKTKLRLTSAWCRNNNFSILALPFLAAMYSGVPHSDTGST